MHPLHQKIQRLRSFAGTPGDFWIELLQRLCELAVAETGTLMRAPDAAGGRDWQPVSRYEGGVGPFSDGWKMLAERASEHGFAVKGQRLTLSLDAAGLPSAS